jgi:hypothetical protein
LFPFLLMVCTEAAYRSLCSEHATGGGISATIELFLHEWLGLTGSDDDSDTNSVQLYDNSLSEWATDESLPMSTCTPSTKAAAAAAAAAARL